MAYPRPPRHADGNPCIRWRSGLAESPGTNCPWSVATLGPCCMSNTPAGCGSAVDDGGNSPWLLDDNGRGGISEQLADRTKPETGTVRIFEAPVAMPSALNHAAPGGGPMACHPRRCGALDRNLSGSPATGK